MSLVQYNGVTLPYPYSETFDQDAVYDEVGQTDRYLTKFNISVRCLVDAAYINYIAPTLNLSPAPVNAAEVMNIIRGKLLQPRQSFAFTQNGVNLLPLLEGPGTVDARQGPQPKSCKLTELDSTTFLMTWVVEANYWEGDIYALTSGQGPTLSTDSIAAQPGNAVLYNRWTEEADIDNCNYTTKTRNGTFRIRSDNNQGLLADQLRTQMAVIGVPKGFLRKSSKFTLDPSGLALSYNIVDGEVFKMPPNPAFEAEGEYTESGTRYGAKRYGEVRVKLKGSKITPQSDLVKAAIAVANKKLRVRGAVLANLTGIPANTQAIGIPESTALRVSMYTNEVEFTMRVMFAVNKARIGGLSAFVNFQDKTGITFTPGSDGAGLFVPPYTGRGTAALLLQAAAYYDPSLLNNPLVNLFSQFEKGDNPATPTGCYGTQFNLGVIPGRAGVIPEGPTDTGS